MDTSKNHRSSKTINIIYFLGSYVIIQLIWWGYRIISLTETAYGPSKTNRTILMIISEGTIFVIILGLAIWQFRASIKKEKKLKERENNMLLAVTHELKTPLSSAKLCLDTLKSRELSPIQRQEVIETGQHSLHRLNLLIDNLLLSKDLSLSNSSEKEKIDLNNECENFVSALKNDRVFLELKQPNTIEFNLEELRIVLSNLIQNALKYSVGKVTVLCTENCLKIKDHGTGIPDKEKKLVFDKFYRSGAELTRSSKGTGIGLFLVKKLVKNNGAKISIEDNQPTGAIFKIKFER